MIDTKLVLNLEKAIEWDDKIFLARTIPERIMAVADIFEALTAADRPYKQSKPLSKTLLIMRQMCEDGHIVLELLTTFCAYWYHI